MQFIHGKTLSQRLMNGPLTPTETAELLIPICRAIAEAHRHGIFHRDLKPSNILIDQEGRPYVTDFGLAKRIDVSRGKSKPNNNRFASVTDTGAIIGTPSYMAPEQAAGQRGKVGPASDIYSLGAMLVRMRDGTRTVSGGHTGRHAVHGVGAGSGSAARHQSQSGSRPRDDHSEVSPKAG